MNRQTHSHSFFRQGIPGALLAALLFALFLTGCGFKGLTPSTGGSGQGSGSGTQTASFAEAPAFLLDGGWKKTGFPYKAPGMDSYFEVPHFQEIGYLELTPEKPDFSFSYRKDLTAYLRNLRYDLAAFTVENTDEGAARRYFLTIRQYDSEESEQIELFTEKGQELLGQVESIDAVTDSDLAILFSRQYRREADESGNFAGYQYRIAHVDASGNLLSLTDVSEGYEAGGVKPDDLYPSTWWCDEQGNSYVMFSGTAKLCIYDPEGNLIMTHPCSSSLGETYPTVFHTLDGSLLFAWSKMADQETNLIWFDVPSRQPVTVATIPTTYCDAFSMEADGEILFCDHNSAYRWNVKTGEGSHLFPFSIFDFEGYQVSHFTKTPAGELILHVWKSEKTEAVYRLSDQEQAQGGVTLIDFTLNGYLQSCASSFSRGRLLDEKIAYQTPPGTYWAENEDFFNRTMADFVAGNGPDMISVFMSQGDWRALCEKGLLADIESLLNPEDLEHIFPGLLASGRVDGQLFGMPFSGMPTELITSDTFCPNGEWTQKEVLDLILERQDELSGIMIEYNGAMSASANLSFLVLNHLDNSPFIDWEKGESHFESEDFQKVLELCKRFGKGEEDKDEVLELLKEGKYLAVRNFLTSHSTYCDARGALEEHQVFVGYPGQTGYSGYWSSVCLVLVNAKTAHPETIADFLRYLTGYESQIEARPYSTGCRDDVMKEIYALSFQRQYGGRYQVDDYVDFLWQHGPWPLAGSAVSDIIEAEAEVYFAGDRDAADTARIIDNRVQLYLDERK